jgi:ribonuclease HII
MSNMASGSLSLYESDAIQKGYRFIAGVDEAGRGPLVGPVVASAVVFSLPPDDLVLKDSKALTPSKRESLLLAINREALTIGVGIVWPSLVDEINIHHASLLAMERAVNALNPAPHLLLIDGLFTIRSAIKQTPIVKGDTLSISIAAASIVAKTTRDHIMDAYNKIYPEYNFARNKGYGTKEHREALRRFGKSPIHRASFRCI